jgi:hypothetical protein
MGTRLRGAVVAEQMWTVNTVSGDQHVWVGDIEEMATRINDAFADYSNGNQFMFLRCQGGALINLAHVVSMVPVG